VNTSILVLSLAILVFVPARVIFHRSPSAPEYPESMTTVLDPESEEYLAWLADHHWPDDEYLDLEREWRAEIEPLYQECPGCAKRGDDVWPCPRCGLLVHSNCGHGMRRRKIAKPYRTRDMGAESVVAEWICLRCDSVVGLDVDRGDEETGLHQ
jgi:hypothetical protein